MPDAPADLARLEGLIARVDAAKVAWDECRAELYADADDRRTYRDTYEMERLSAQRESFEALPGLLAELKEARERAGRLISVTWGQLYDAYPEVANEILSHEWDNMNTVEQQEWLLMRLTQQREHAENYRNDRSVLIGQLERERKCNAEDIAALKQEVERLNRQLLLGAEPVWEEGK